MTPTPTPTKAAAAFISTNIVSMGTPQKGFLWISAGGV
jgi:hypothetical protein